MFYCDNSDSDVPVMHIDKHIGSDVDDGMGIDGAAFARELMMIDEMGKKSIEIWINSVGGAVTDAMAIYHAILASKTQVNTKNTGVAISSAGFIFGAGHTRTMCDYSLLMMHNPYNIDEEGADPDDKSLEFIKEAIVKMLATRSGKTEDEISKLMEATTWMNADEAVAQGFADKIEKSAEQNAPKLRKGNPVAAYKKASLWLNSGTEKTEQMKTVLNKLGLNPDAKEESVLAAINKFEADNKITTDALAAAEKDLKEAKDKFFDMENKYNALKEAKDKLDKENLEKAEKETKEKAVDLVTNAVNAGKIKKEEKAIKPWVDMAIANYQSAKDALDAIATNKKGINAIENVSGDVGSKLEHAAGSAMADLRDKFKL